MPVECAKHTSGGKGNVGKFYEREPRICAAGIPTSQPDDDVASCLKRCLLQDEVDVLLRDAVLPPPRPKPSPPLRRPVPLDMRYAGPFCHVAQLVNPPAKTKFQTLVSDFKDTTYTSYWKKNVGQVPDEAPMFPKDYDILGTTYGKKLPNDGPLYDILMPKEPLPDKTPYSRYAGVQTDRCYKPPFSKFLTYGHKIFNERHGIYAKRCLTDNNVLNGKYLNKVLNATQTAFQEFHKPPLGAVHEPNKNIEKVPEGYAFGDLKPPGNIPECLTTCEVIPDRDYFKKCLRHLNSLRRSLHKRFLPSFFNTLYLNFKYFDKENTDWLPKKTVYDYCEAKFIRLEQPLIEHLLKLLDAFCGSNIKYKTLVSLINYTLPTPKFPKIKDISDECLYFTTTYREMVKPCQRSDTGHRAGLPSGRYLDMDYPKAPFGCCKADNKYLPQESTAKSRLNPSVMTLMNVTHRDMFAQREQQEVKRVFEAAGEIFTDEKFNAVWEEAKRHHSQGLVCYETFRRALDNYVGNSNVKKDDGSMTS
ncbi:EF-hand domain-containing family member B [Eumeta japonica]|uniref:EF-hand domain-containing family member B n=1 Tax=Eumeta variegata TaxID=151549 RepID=A0A4C1T006_EUMVA|nr:EF-hand domain-containing family member B [Eumeta japonica]